MRGKNLSSAILKLRPFRKYSLASRASWAYYAHGPGKALLLPWDTQQELSKGPCYSFIRVIA